MTITYFNYLYDITQTSVGPSIHVREFVQAMRQLGHHIHPHFQNLLPDGRDPAAGDNSLKVRLRQWLKARLSRYLNQPHLLLKNIGYIIREYHILRNEKPDVLLVRYDLMNFSGLVLAKSKGIPVVLEVNAPHAYESGHFYRHIRSWPLLPEFIERLDLRLADKVIVVSEQLRRFFLQKGIPGRKIAVVPNGANVDRFRRPGLTREVRWLRAELGVNPGDIVVGFTGSFHYWHGIHALKVIISQVLPRYTALKLLLIGRGFLMRELQKVAAQAGLQKRVLFQGYIPYEDLPAYLLLMDIVVIPYPRIDFFYFSPLKLFEAMAAGRAVLASRIGQIGEILQDGRNGLLYEPDNMGEMISKLDQLVNNVDLRQKLGQEAQKTIERHFSWLENASKISLICQAAINHKSSKK